MVGPARRRKAVEPGPAPQRLSTSVKLSEVFAAGLRFEAGAFSIDARHAIETMRAAGIPLVLLYGPGGLCQEAHNAFRFVRIYVSPERGVPFLSSADIISMRPEIDCYLSRKLTKNLDELIIKNWDVLISCSGTIGNVGLASASFAGKALSQHAIRLRARDAETAGYITAFLRCRYGRLQLIQATYGSVIKHIEPAHLERVLIPELPGRRNEIGRKVKRAYELRDEANSLLDEADTKLHDLLKLPYLSEVHPDTDGPVVLKLRASALANRFEASFHDPVAQRAEKILDQIGFEIAQLTDSRVTGEIRPVTKFRKRLYVHTGGIQMLSSKQLMQIDPVDVKRLATGAHTKDLPEIALNENMVTVSCSGTIGRVQIIPAYMEGWTANQHATRIVAANCMNPGFLYAWLASDYGQILTRRCAYGSVILEIDKGMLGSVLIPLPQKKARDQIGNLVLRANELRGQAWEVERQSIEELESIIERRASRRTECSA
jgi:type I restriction enzyme S subunit